EQHKECTHKNVSGAWRSGSRAVTIMGYGARAGFFGSRSVPVTLPQPAAAVQTVHPPGPTTIRLFSHGRGSAHHIFTSGGRLSCPRERFVPTAGVFAVRREGLSPPRPRPASSSAGARSPSPPR